jgi:hypothetical protein
MPWHINRRPGHARGRPHLGPGLIAAATCLAASAAAPGPDEAGTVIVLKSRASGPCAAEKRTAVARPAHEADGQADAFWLPADPEVAAAEEVVE